MRWPPLPDLLHYALRAAAALLAGSLLMAAFDFRLPLWPLIFIALVPLLWAIRGVRPLEAVVYGLLTFWSFLSVHNWWMSRFGPDKTLTLCFMEGMAYAIALGLFVWLRHRLRRDPFHLLLPACLVLVEFKRNIGVWAFPWPMLGHALVFETVLLQAAAVVGVLGLSFIVVWANSVLAGLFFEEVRPPQARWVQVRPFLAVLAWMGLYGQYSLLAAPWIDRQLDPVPATVVQRVKGTLDEWNDAFIIEALHEYNTLTREQLRTAGLLEPGLQEMGPPIQPPAHREGLIVWAENAVPKSLTQAGQERIDEVVQDLVDDTGQVLIFGTFTRVPAGAPEPGSAAALPLTPEVIAEYTRRIRTEGAPYDAYNSVELRVPGGTGPAGTTSKYHLVPFGESVPMKRYLAIVDNPWGPGQNVSAARRLEPLETPLGKVGVVVCYESFFAPIVRTLVRQGARIMVLTSNTSWYGDYLGATWQHAYFDRARAVENRVPFVRSATTGVSSIIDPWGRELALADAFEGRLLPGEAPRVEGAARTAWIRPRYGLSVYTVLGDWVVLLSALGIGLALFSVWYAPWWNALVQWLKPAGDPLWDRAEAGTIAPDA